jgi:hypothetical protein
MNNDKKTEEDCADEFFFIIRMIYNDFRTFELLDNELGEIIKSNRYDLMGWDGQPTDFDKIWLDGGSG